MLAIYPLDKKTPGTCTSIDGLWYVAVSSTLTEVGIRRISNNIENVLRNISGSLLIVVAFYMILIILRDLI